MQNNSESEKESTSFKWPEGAGEELTVYSDEHPQRKPTEDYFANYVRKKIEDIRTGEEYADLWLMISSLEDLENPTTEQRIPLILLGDHRCARCRLLS